MTDIQAAIGRAQLRDLPTWQRAAPQHRGAVRRAAGRTSRHPALPHRPEPDAGRPRLAPVPDPGAAQGRHRSRRGDRRGSPTRAIGTSVHFIPVHHLRVLQPGRAWSRPRGLSGRGRAVRANCCPCRSTPAHETTRSTLSATAIADALRHHGISGKVSGMSVHDVCCHDPRQREPGLRAIVVGAGEAGRALARDLLRVSSFGLQPVGFLDDDSAKQAGVQARPPGPRHPGRPRAVLERYRRGRGRGRDPLDALARGRAQLGLRAAAQGVTVSASAPVPRRAAATRSPARTCAPCRSGPLIGRPEMHVVSRRAAAASSPASGCWSPAPAAPSAASSAARSRASARASWSCSTTTSRTCTGCSSSCGARRLLDTDDAVVADIRDRGADAPGLPRAPAADRLPRRRAQAPAGPRAAPLRGREVERRAAPRTWSRPRSPTTSSASC